MSEPIPAIVPAGVAIGFLQLLQRQQTDGLRRMILWLALILAVTALAVMVHPLWGPVAQLIASGLTFAVGWFVVKGKLALHQRSLKDNWKEWMEMAPIAPSTDALAANVQGKPYRVTFRVSLLVSASLLLEIVAFIFAFHDEPTIWKAIPLMMLHAAFGLYLAWAVQSYRWHKELRQSLEEMVGTGELGVWGVR